MLDQMKNAMPCFNVGCVIVSHNMKKGDSGIREWIVIFVRTDPLTLNVDKMSKRGWNLKYPG